MWIQTVKITSIYTLTGIRTKGFSDVEREIWKYDRTESWKCRKTENRDRFESGGKKDLENQKMSIRAFFVLFLGMFSGKLYVVFWHALVSFYRFRWYVRSWGKSRYRGYQGPTTITNNENDRIWITALFQHLQSQSKPAKTQLFHSTHWSSSQIPNPYL